MVVVGSFPCRSSPEHMDNGSKVFAMELRARRTQPSLRGNFLMQKQSRDFRECHHDPQDHKLDANEWQEASENVGQRDTRRCD